MRRVLLVIAVLLFAQSAGAQPYAYAIGSGAYRSGIYYTSLPYRLITVDTAAGRAIASLPLTGCIFPTSVAAAPDGTRVFVTCAGSGDVSGAILSIDPVAKQVVATRTFTWPAQGVAFLPGTSRALVYVGNATNAALVLDVSTLSTVATISLAGQATTLLGSGVPIEISADARRAYLGFHSKLSGAIVVLDLDALTVSAGVSLPSGGGALDLSLSSDGSTLGILTMSGAAVMSTSTNVVTTLRESQTSGVVANATGNRLYVSVPALAGTAESLDVLDTASGAVLQTFAAPAAGRMESNAARDRVYVSGYGAPEHLLVMNPADGTVISSAVARGITSWSPAVPQASPAIAADACTYAIGFKSGGFVLPSAPRESPEGSTGGRLDVIALPDGCAWSAQADVPWITFEYTSGSGPDNVGFTIAPNTTGATRTGTITIGGQTLTVTQAGCSNPLIYLERPIPGSIVAQPIRVSGWAIDTCAPSGTGIQMTSGSDTGYGGARPDVAAAFGSSQFTNSGFSFLYQPEQQAGPQNVGATFTDTVTGAPVSETVLVNVLPSQPPFGYVDTPADGATVSGDVPLTGWVLDDVRIQNNIFVYRNALAGETPTPNVGNRVFIGLGTRVTGTRPDVQAAFPGYPENDRAGFGLMILTNTLPGGGNGTFTFSVDAGDAIHSQVTIGSRTVTVDNASSPLPFGAVDIPSPGQTVSGSFYVWGWALTPPPSSISPYGFTIDVIIDDVVAGHPTYNQLRTDVQALFPGYANSAGAGGYFLLDTRTLANGLHTISWVVRDDGGHAKGIGSRYFTVANP